MEQLQKFINGELEMPYFYYDLDYGVWDDEACIDYIPKPNGRRLYLSQNAE